MRIARSWQWSLSLGWPRIHRRPSGLIWRTPERARGLKAMDRAGRSLLEVRGIGGQSFVLLSSLLPLGERPEASSVPADDTRYRAGHRERRAGTTERRGGRRQDPLGRWRCPGGHPRDCSSVTRTLQELPRRGPTRLLREEQALCGAIGVVVEDEQHRHDKKKRNECDRIENNVVNVPHQNTCSVVHFVRQIQRVSRLRMAPATGSATAGEKETNQGASTEHSGHRSHRALLEIEHDHGHYQCECSKKEPMSLVFALNHHGGSNR
jgi:hypothetical protein